MAVVIHGFLATFPFKYPTFPSALFITTRFKFFHLSSVVPCRKHCTSSSISFLNSSTLVTRLSNFHFFCCLLLGIFLNLSFNRIAKPLGCGPSLHLHLGNSMSSLHYSDTSVVQVYSQFDIFLSLLDSSMCTFFFFPVQTKCLLSQDFGSCRIQLTFHLCRFFFLTQTFLPLYPLYLLQPTALKSPITITLSVPFSLPNIAPS